MSSHLIETTESSEEVFSGVFLKVVRDEVRLPDGAITAREYIHHTGAVAVVAITDEGRVVMERQYRHPLKQVFLEIPAGKLEAGEDALVCAQRELLEETGFTAAAWMPLGVMHPCIGYADESIQYFLARGLVRGTRILDDGEFLDVLEMPFEAVIAGALDGRITDGKTIAGLFWAERAIRLGF